MLATTIVVPVVLLAIMATVQFALTYHARRVLAGAAADGAASAARAGAVTDDGARLAADLVASSGSGVLHNVRVTGARTGRTVVITAEGDVVVVLPLLPAPHLRASASATVETFDPEGSRP